MGINEGKNCRLTLMDKMRNERIKELINVKETLNDEIERRNGMDTCER